MKLKKLIKKVAAPLLAEVGFIPARTRRRSSSRRPNFREVVGPYFCMTGNVMSEVEVRDLVKRAKVQVESLEEGGDHSVRMAEAIESQVRSICCEHLAAKGPFALSQAEVWDAFVDASFESRASYFEFLRKLAEVFNVVDSFTTGEENGRVKGRVVVEVSTANRSSLHGAVLDGCNDPRISFSLKEYRV